MEGGILVLRQDFVLRNDGRCGLGPMEAEVVAEGRERRQKRRGEERHDYGDDGSQKNIEGMESETLEETRRRQERYTSNAGVISAYLMGKRSQLFSGNTGMTITLYGM